MYVSLLRVIEGKEIWQTAHQPVIMRALQGHSTAVASARAKLLGFPETCPTCNFGIVKRAVSFSASSSTAPSGGM